MNIKISSENINDLEHDFIDEKIKELPEHIIVDDIFSYHYSYSSKIPLYEAINNNKQIFVIYVCPLLKFRELKKEYPDYKFSNMLVLYWEKENLTYKPKGIKFINSNIAQKYIFENEEISIENKSIIPNNVKVEFISIVGSQPLEAKVDTGADISSLHVDELNIKDDKVSFFNKSLSENIITLPLENIQQVKLSNGTTENRPVISMEIKINDDIIKTVEFNLNDRSEMDFQVLLGKNALDDVLINVVEKEFVDYDIFENIIYEELNEGNDGEE